MLGHSLASVLEKEREWRCLLSCKMPGSEGTKSLGSKDAIERPEDIGTLCGVEALSGKYAGEEREGGDVCSVVRYRALKEQSPLEARMQLRDPMI